MISAEVFKAFYSETMAILPDDVRENYICDALGLSFTELNDQPADWVQKQLIYLEGKSKAEKAKMDKKE